MKRPIAILLLLCLAIQIGGQFALREYRQYKTEKFFNEQAGRGKYNVAELTEVRIRVNLPTISDWRSYENISGQIQFQNTCYNYVKMKLTRNYMYLMCIPNYEKTQMVENNVISAKGVKDIPIQKKNHVPADKVAAADAFHFSFIQFAFNTPVKELISTITLSAQQISCKSLDIPEQPPKTSC